jgi:hypothetical protein
LKKYFLTFLGLLNSCIGFSQLILNKPMDVAVGPVHFNPDIIKKNKIRSIAITIVDKPDGTVIIDKGESKGYEFDDAGYVTRYYYTVLNKIQTEEVEVPAIKKRGKIVRPAGKRLVTKYINDTIFVNVFYDDQKRLVGKRVRAGDYYDAYYYEYNEQNQIRKELHCKETNISENKKEFKMGVQTLLSVETFEYLQLTATQIKKRCLNDEGREYKKAIINYDSKGNKLSENYEFMVSWMRQEKAWQYDDNGKLVKQSIVSNEGGDVNEYSIYEYVKNGVLLTEHKFKNNQLTEEINYMYDEGNVLIKSEVNRDHKNASIDIVKYAYTFY